MVQGRAGELLGSAGGWARVKSGFVFPILSIQGVRGYATRGP
jgi:hypothetical protein